MKICIDARNPSFGGTYTYIVSLLEAISAIDVENEYLVLYDDLHGPLKLNGVDERIVIGHSSIRMVLWNQYSLSTLLKSEKIDVYHALKQLSNPHTSARTVYTIHATNHFLFPELWKKHELAYWRWATRSCVRNADVVIAISQVEKENLIHFTRVRPENVHVVSLAPHKRFHPVTDQNLLQITRQKFGLPENFMLFVGNIYPFKNVSHLVRAFHTAVSNYDLPHKLVLAGGHGKSAKEVFSLVKSLGIADRVIAPGFVRAELPALYSLADLFIFPSIFESFGLPLVEAMSCGVPVITSNVWAIPEVVGEAAIQVDPYSVDALAEVMAKVVCDRLLHQDLVWRGLERAKMFSWERCARETVALYEREVG